MNAVIKTGGKQYIVAPGDALNVEKLEGKVGDKVKLDCIALLDGKKSKTVAMDSGKIKVEAKIVEQFRGEKI